MPGFLVEKRIKTEAIPDYTPDDVTARARGPSSTRVYVLEDSPHIVSK